MAAGTGGTTSSPTTNYDGLANGPEREFVYTRLQPTATVGSANVDVAAVVASPATPGNYAQAIILEFTSITDADYPGNQLLVPNVIAMRQSGSDLVRGFTVAGDRTSGGIIEVRSYAKLSNGSFSTTGTLIPCRVDYVPGYTPFNVVESASLKVRISLTPATLVNGRAFWASGAKIICDVQPIMPTKVVQY